MKVQNRLKNTNLKGAQRKEHLVLFQGPFWLSMALSVTPRAVMILSHSLYLSHWDRTLQNALQWQITPSYHCWMFAPDSMFGFSDSLVWTGFVRAPSVELSFLKPLWLAASTFHHSFYTLWTKAMVVFYWLHDICRLSWQDGLEVRTLASKLSSLGLNPDPAMNCHPDVSQAGWFIDVCAVPRMDVKLGVPSAGIS